MVIPTLIEVVAKRLHIPEAEIGRRLGTDRNRLYQWKTYKRRMPTPALYKLATLAGTNVTNVIGQYGLEWQHIRARRGRAPFVMRLPRG
jgi:hypothetical protein